jgi:hypothetical protein
MAAASDDEYLDATAQSLTKAKWGTFFIPGIDRDEDLRLAARYGMSFVRTGRNVTETAQAEPYSLHAKELGLIVFYNAMKSYAVSPEEFGVIVGKVHLWEADIACLVRGSMHSDSVALTCAPEVPVHSFSWCIAELAGSSESHRQIGSCFRLRPFCKK